MLQERRNPPSSLGRRIRKMIALLRLSGRCRSRMLADSRPHPQRLLQQPEGTSTGFLFESPGWLHIRGIFSASHFLCFSRRLAPHLIGLVPAPFRGYMRARSWRLTTQAHPRARARDDDAAREPQCQARIRGRYSSTHRRLVRTHTFAQIRLRSGRCSGNKKARWPGPRRARAIRRR